MIRFISFSPGSYYLSRSAITWPDGMVGYTTYVNTKSFVDAINVYATQDFPPEVGNSRLDVNGRRQNSVFHRNFTGDIFANYESTKPLALNSSSYSDLPQGFIGSATLASKSCTKFKASQYWADANVPIFPSPTRSGRFYTAPIGQPYYIFDWSVVADTNSVMVTVSIVAEGGIPVSYDTRSVVLLTRDKVTGYVVCSRTDTVKGVVSSSYRNTGALRHSEPVLCGARAYLGVYGPYSITVSSSYRPETVDELWVYAQGLPIVGYESLDFYPAVYSATTTIDQLGVNNIENMIELPQLVHFRDEFTLVFNQARSRVGFVKAIAAAYLFYQYAVMPVVRDIQSTNEYHQAYGDSGKYTVYGTSRQSVASTAWTLRAEVIGQYAPSHVASIVARALRSAGLELNLSNLWDLLPFSFMLDWVFPVQDCLRRFDLRCNLSSNAWMIDTCITSSKAFTTWTFKTKVLGTLLESQYSRLVSDKAPTYSPTGDVNVTLGKNIVEATAIFVSNL